MAKLQLSFSPSPLFSVCSCSCVSECTQKNFKWPGQWQQNHNPEEQLTRVSWQEELPFSVKTLWPSTQFHVNMFMNVFLSLKPTLPICGHPSVNNPSCWPPNGNYMEKVRSKSHTSWFPGKSWVNTSCRHHLELRNISKNPLWNVLCTGDNCEESGPCNQEECLPWGGSVRKRRHGLQAPNMCRVPGEQAGC